MSEKHRQAGANYAALHRDFNLFVITSSQQSNEDNMAWYKDLLARLNQLEKESPDVPDRFYDQAVQEQKSDKEGI
jgi:hypothetical protein